MANATPRDRAREFRRQIRNNEGNSGDLDSVLELLETDDEIAALKAAKAIESLAESDPSVLVSSAPRLAIILVGTEHDDIVYWLLEAIGHLVKESPEVYDRVATDLRKCSKKRTLYDRDIKSLLGVWRTTLETGVKLSEEDVQRVQAALTIKNITIQDLATHVLYEVILIGGEGTEMAINGLLATLEVDDEQFRRNSTYMTARAVATRSDLFSDVADETSRLLSENEDLMSDDEREIVDSAIQKLGDQE